MDQNNENAQVTNTQHDLYIHEIESIDDYWGPTFRYNNTFCIMYQN